MAKMAKATIKKGHDIAKKIYARGGVSKSRAYAMGTAAAKKQSRRRR